MSLTLELPRVAKKLLAKQPSLEDGVDRYEWNAGSRPVSAIWVEMDLVGVRGGGWAWAWMALSVLRYSWCGGAIEVQRNRSSRSMSELVSEKATIKLESRLF